jgi:hypothetical protein
MAVVGWIIVTLAVGLWAFWLRCRARFYYGVSEVILALVFIFFSFYGGIHLKGGNGVAIFVEFSWIKFLYWPAVTLVAGIYFVVRGLDSMDQDDWPKWLPPKLRRNWDFLFHRSKRRASL